MNKSLPDRPAKGFERLALASTVAVYVLIFIGGLVRVSGAGMGCPDWPKCFGRWIPPLSLSQIPPDIDPTLFNLTLAWIEYFNRLTGMAIGFLLVAAAVVALVRFRSYPRILYPTLAAAVLVAIQGWQGSIVVASDLTPVIVSVHMLLALVIASLLTWVWQEVYYLNRSMPGEKSIYPGKAKFWVGMLWIGGIAQLILGTQVRAAGELIREQMPLISSLTILSEIGNVHQIHIFAGVALILFTAYVAIMLLRLSQAPSNLVRYSSYGLVILALAQVVVGFVMSWVGLGPIMQLFHLWGAALYIGLVLVLYSAMKRRQENLAEPSRSFGRIIVATFIVVVSMAVVSASVVEQAEASRAEISVLYDIPEFTFKECRGDSFGREDFMGKLTVVDFIFTSCQGICPPMTRAMKELYDRYEHSDKIQFVSFTVDPEIDTPERLLEFATEYGVNDNRWFFVRGEIDEIKKLAGDGFYVNNDLPVNHSARFILVDEEGIIRGYYHYNDESSLRLLEQHIRTLSLSIS